MNPLPHTRPINRKTTSRALPVEGYWRLPFDSRLAMTLIEMLTVIAIIAVLAGMLLPAIRGGALKAQKVRAAKDVQDIATAIKHYYADYSRMPVSGNIPFRTLPNTPHPATTADPDFTFGTFGIITNSTQNSLFVTNNNGV